METVRWKSATGRYTEFSLTDLWKANNVAMSEKLRHVVILSTSNSDVPEYDHRYIVNTFAETVSKDALTNPKQRMSLALCGVSTADTDKWFTVDAAVKSFEEMKSVYFDTAEHDDSFKRLVEGLQRNYGDIHFIHINIS